MKTTTLLYSVTTLCAFLGTYFLNLGADNAEQYLTVTAVVFIDGFFGVWAGTKLEGFETRKAIRVLQTAVTWVVLLTGVLMIEKSFQGTSWLSETLVAPFVTFQLVSAVKNAARAGLIKNELLQFLLRKIDKHKVNEKRK
jgi:phage-related holin